MPGDKSSFDKYSFDSDGSRRRSSDFDDWYRQFERLREHWHTDKHRIKRELKEEFKREKEEWKAEFRRATGGKEPKQVMGEAVRALMGIIDDTVAKSASTKRLSEAERMHIEQHRRREEDYYRLSRKIENTERRLEKKRKSFKVFTVLTGAFGVGFLFDSDFAALPLIFGGLAALNFWTTRDVEEKLHRLYSEREAFGALPSAPTFSSEMEKTILRHAYERQGRVYPQMLAINSDLSLAEIEQMLNLCVDKRLASIELDEKGRTYYYFSSLDDSDPYANLSGTPT